MPPTAAGAIQIKLVSIKPANSCALSIGTGMPPTVGGCCAYAESTNNARDITPTVSNTKVLIILFMIKSVHL